MKGNYLPYFRVKQSHPSYHFIRSYGSFNCSRVSKIHYLGYLVKVVNRQEEMIIHSIELTGCASVALFGVRV